MPPDALHKFECPTRGAGGSKMRIGAAGTEGEERDKAETCFCCTLGEEGGRGEAHSTHEWKLIQG